MVGILLWRLHSQLRCGCLVSVASCVVYQCILTVLGRLFWVTLQLVYQVYPLNYYNKTGKIIQQLTGYVLFAVCTHHKGNDFRQEFSHISEIRSVIFKNVNMMAVTATASSSTRQLTMELLEMFKCHIILQLLNRQLIFSIQLQRNLKILWMSYCH